MPPNHALHLTCFAWAKWQPKLAFPHSLCSFGAGERGRWADPENRIGFVDWRSACTERPRSE